MNPFQAESASVEVIELPLRRPFVTALGRKERTRNAAITLRLKGGGSGYGEASSSLAMRRHTAGRLAAALRSLARRAVGRDIRYTDALVRAAWESCPLPAAAAAFECALFEALASAHGVSLAEWLGAAARRLSTDLTIAAVPAREAAEAAAEARREGFAVLKVKVAGDAREDLRRVLAVHDAAQRPALLLDGNQGFTVSGALRLTEACLRKGVNVRLFEQPLPAQDLAGMAEVCRRSPVPIAADESARSVAQALEVIERGAADVINVKVAKTGLRASLEIVALARAARKRLMLGCMMESARGLSSSVHLGLGTGAFDFVDLDSDQLLADGQPRGRFTRRGPILEPT